MTIDPTMEDMRPRVVIGERASGKTTSLIHWAQLADHRWIVEPGIQRREQVIRLWAQLYDIPYTQCRVIDTSQWKDHARLPSLTSGPAAEYGLDDCFDMIYQEFGVTPRVVTFDGQGSAVNEDLAVECYQAALKVRQGEYPQELADLLIAASSTMSNYKYHDTEIPSLEEFSAGFEF